MVGGKEESINSVQFLKTDPKARYQGYSFYFREGFCWNLINGTRSSNDLKFRMAPIGVNDVGSMTLHLCEHNFLSNSLILAVGNSLLINKYTEAYVNFTVNFQVNDCRQIPIIIPSSEELQNIESLIDKVISIKKSALETDSETDCIDTDLLLIENEIDNAVLSLYRI